MRLLALLLVLAAGCRAHPAPPRPSSDFGYYLLAMSASCGKLTLHGLWPNFTEAQARGKPRAWPQYCGDYAHCEKAEDASCAPAAAVPAELAPIAPDYVSGTLATHEWSKHGSCTALPAAKYFQAELAAIRSIPNRALPAGDVARADLARGFGVPAESVVLGCDAQCRFTQVAFCLAKDAGDHPTTPTPCTASVTSSEYDNGCVTRGCERVTIPACAAP